MKPSSNTLILKVRLGWIFLAGGVIAILAGLVVQFSNPNTDKSMQWVTGLGILLAGIGAALLAAYLPASRSASAAERKVNSDTDERNISIRNAAGYVAFLVSIIVNYTALFIYSALTRSVNGFDSMWYTLVFLSVFPLAVFLFFTARYQKRM